MSKYRAVKTTRTLGKDLYAFDSKAEAAYFDKLVLQLKANEIRDFSCQPEFVLTDGYKINTSKTKTGTSRQSSIKYLADFRYYTKDGKCVVVDVKGVSTPVFNLKKKLFLNKLSDFGIDEFHIVFRDRLDKYFPAYLRNGEHNE